MLGHGTAHYDQFVALPNASNDSLILHVHIITQMLCMLQAAGFTKQPAMTLHILPLCELPFLEASFTPTWHLPDGHNQEQHHLFPVPVPVRQTC